MKIDNIECINVINQLIQEKQYNQAMKKCNEIIIEVDEFKLQKMAFRKILARVYYNKSRIYYKTNKLEKVFEMAHLSLKHCIDLPEIQAKNYWMIGMYYESKENKINALQYYNEGLNILKDLELNYLYYNLLSNKGELLADENLILQAIEFYKSNDKNLYHKNIQHRYECLFHIYINKNMIINAEHSLLHINNKELHKKLESQLKEVTMK